MFPAEDMFKLIRLTSGEMGAMERLTACVYSWERTDRANETDKKKEGDGGNHT